MDRMYETRCCSFDGDDGAECSDCAYIGTYFDFDVMPIPQDDTPDF